MAIDRDTHLVNTERMRLKKLTAKFWKEVEAVENLTDLLLISVDDVSPYLEKIRHLSALEKLKLAQLELDGQISNLILPSSLTQLEISNVKCMNWTELPDAPQVKEFVHKRMELSDLCLIYRKLSGVESMKMSPDGDDELNAVFELINVMENVKQVELDVFDASKDALLPMLRESFGRQIKIKLSYSGDLSADELEDIITPFSDCVTLEYKI